MKKKIAIFGDSFGATYWNENEYDAWPDLLSKDYTVTNFSKNGSSLWYSYQKIKENYKNFDKCVFIATVYGRFYLEGMDHHLNINPNSWPFKDGVNLGKVYYGEFFSFSREEAFHQFMINDLLTLENIIYIPGFAECEVAGSSVSLNNIATRELQHYGVWQYQGPDDRKCHLSREHNVLMYKKISDTILNNNKFLSWNESEFITPNEPFNFYFNKDAVK